LAIEDSGFRTLGINKPSIQCNNPKDLILNISTVELSVLEQFVHYLQQLIFTSSFGLWCCGIWFLGATIWKEHTALIFMVCVRMEAGCSSINNYQTTQCDDQGTSCILPVMKTSNLTSASNLNASNW